MLFAFCLLLARWAGDAIGLIGSGAPASLLWNREALQSACLYFTAAAALRLAVAGLRPVAARAGLLLLTAAGAAFTAADGASLRYLQQDLIHAAGNLLSLHVGAKDAFFYATEYIPLPLLAVALGAHALIALAFRRRPEPVPRWRWALAAIAALQWAGLNRTALGAEVIGWAGGGESPAATQPVPFRPLSATVHRAPVPRRPELPAPATIVVFINESLPRHAADSGGTRGALLAGIVSRIEPRSGPWIEFPRARTNSSVTDISVPSILTGVDPIEGIGKLEAMPFLFDLAHAAGYRTAFFTAQDYSWASFHSFYRPARIGTYVTGDRLGLPKVNDSGIDDMAIADRVAAYIHGLRPGDRALLVVNSNAWHVPFQTTSRIPVPAGLASPERKAAYILERYYAEIFSSLDNAGRLRGSLLIVTSDHGEYDPARPRAVDRLRNHFEEVTNIPFYVHLPAGTPAASERALRINADANVANVDIAPTLADCLGFGPPADLAYAGRSLLEPIPAGRVEISVTTCEWKQWNSTAFGMSRGAERFIFMERQGGFLFDLDRDPKEEHGRVGGADYEFFLQKAAAIPVLEDMLLRADIRSGGS